VTDLRRFPRRTLRGNRTLHRMHRAHHRPWWFSSDGSGRFDPVGTGLGACYLAEEPLGAWVESYRKAMKISEADIADRRLVAVALGRDLRLADVTSRRALAFGVTAAVGAGEDYRPSQQFARDAISAGFGGVRYHFSHDPAQGLHGVALFAPAGEPAPADPDWPVALGTVASAHLIAEAARRFGYAVLPIP
jgi:RES domain-containing protein